MFNKIKRFWNEEMFIPEEQHAVYINGKVQNEGTLSDCQKYVKKYVRQSVSKEYGWRFTNPGVRNYYAKSLIEESIRITPMGYMNKPISIGKVIMYAILILIGIFLSIVTR